jgi:hypothetical protein
MPQWLTSLPTVEAAAAVNAAETARDVEERVMLICATPAGRAGIRSNGRSDPASSVMAACSSYWAVIFLTTPWIACVPKWPVAGPVYTSVTFDHSISDPPMIQTCRVDGPILSKGAGLPFAEVVAVPVSIMP